ncbi:PepSY-associated TM helix domain-containing protein [Methylorubrum populi]|uniref:PepSY-associated TM helix domain-containing protein n=2 Tax=Methylorubrum populi TaxID=223967 RepID=A0A169R7P6_9HYPH|nr:PepSY-associated TM helix domain-containing protein [Methylorubrum populi]
MTHPARIMAGMSARRPGVAAKAPVRFTASRSFRIALWLHRWTGLIAAPFFLILCISGTILIFHEEIDEGFGYATHTDAASPGTPPRPLSEIVAAALATAPARRPLALVFDADHPERVTVSLVEPGARAFDGAKPVVLDRYRGTAIEAPDPRSTPTGIILTLHANWFLGLPGELAGGVVALLVVICLVSGIVIYGPFIRGLAFGLIRRGRGERLRQRDLHNFLGTVTLGWALLVSATGVTLALGDIALKVWQATELQRLAATHGGHKREAGPIAGSGSSLDAVRAAAEAAKPGWRTSLMLYPGSAFSTERHFTVLLVGPEGLQKRLFEIALVDAADARVAEIAALPWYLVVTQLSQPLHFGDYGGLPLKLLWTACAWFTLFITGNGAWLWFARHPRRRKARDDERGVRQAA